MRIRNGWKTLAAIGIATLLGSVVEAKDCAGRDVNINSTGSEMEEVTIPDLREGEAYPFYDREKKSWTATCLEEGLELAVEGKPVVVLGESGIRVAGEDGQFLWVQKEEGDGHGTIHFVDRDGKETSFSMSTTDDGHSSFHQWTGDGEEKVLSFTVEHEDDGEGKVIILRMSHDEDEGEEAEDDEG